MSLLFQVIDVGSGKGYLSENLSRFHGLTVVGVDSRVENTDGAVDRCKKMEKMHRRLLKSQSQQQIHHSEEKSSHQSVDGLDINLPLTFAEEGDDTVTDCGSLHNTTEGFCEVSSSELHVHVAERKDGSPLTYRPGHPQICSEGATSLGRPTVTEERSSLSYLPFTYDIHVDDDIMQLAKDCSVDKFEMDFPTLIEGLHACGDLGSTALRLFTRVPALHAICLVGCCYHHISELSTDPTGIGCFLFYYA